MNTFSAVQFYGVDKVCEAANNRGCPCWAIFQGKQFLFKHEEVDMVSSLDMLNKTLECMAAGQAIYTIRFYEPEVDAKGKPKDKQVKIKSGTDYDGSFNFRLISEDERMERNQRYMSGTNAVMQKLEEITGRLDAIENGETETETEPEEDNSITGILLGLLKEPAKITQLISSIADVKNLVNGTSPAYVGQVHQAGQLQGAGGSPGPGPSTELSQQLSDDQEQDFLIRIGNAIDKLRAVVPDIDKHLEKMGNLATTDPAKLKQIVSMINFI